MRVLIAALASFIAFAATSATALDPAAGPFVYLRCQSTSLDLDAKSLMETEDGNTFSIGYTAEERLLISAGEQCVFTVTDVLGEETENSVSYVADLPFLSTVAPGTFYTAVPAGGPGEGSFRVQYMDLFGPYSAVFYLNEKSFAFSPTIWFK